MLVHFRVRNQDRTQPGAFLANLLLEPSSHWSINPIEETGQRTGCLTKAGTMLRSIPWDVWVAAAIAAVVALAAFFDLSPAIFIFIFLGLCAYIAVQTFGSERDK
jgi:hypothetical protein